MYAYLYVADKYEGLITVGAATIIDGNPLNNFLKREVTFNPGGRPHRGEHDHDLRDLRLHTCDAGAGGRLARRPHEART